MMKHRSIGVFVFAVLVGSGVLGCSRKEETRSANDEVVASGTRETQGENAIPSPLPSLGAEDPCSATAKENIDVSDDGLSAKIRGANAACLSRVLNGAFVASEAKVVCRTGTFCEITLRDRGSVTLTGEEANRLNSQFLLGPDPIRKRFDTSGPEENGNFARIECRSAVDTKADATCAISISKGARLPT